MLDFPSSPTNGQTFAAPNGVVYTYQTPPGRWNDSGSGDSGGSGGDSTPDGSYPSASNGLVGDGVTDNAAALQALIDIVTAAGGGTIQFARGVFRLDSQIFLKDKVFLRGAGPSQTTLDFSQKGFFQNDANGGALIQTSGGGVSNQVSVTANVAAGALAIPVSSITGFVPGDWIMIRSNELYEAKATIAEIAHVQWVNAGFVYLNNPLTFSYNISGFSVNVVKLTTISGGISDLTIKGAGINPASQPSPPYTGTPNSSLSDAQTGDDGIEVRFGKDYMIDTVDLIGVEGLGIRFAICIGTVVRNSVISFDAMHVFPQYGIYVYAANLGTLITDSKFYNGRHHITTGYTNAVTQPYWQGIPIGLIITGNRSIGCWVYAIDTHQAAWDATVSNNIIEGLCGGILMRGRNCTVTSNIVTLPNTAQTGITLEYCITARYGLENTIIANNRCLGGGFGIYSGSPETVGTRSVISGNTINRTNSSAIYIAAGNTNFSIVGNICQPISAAAVYYAIYIINSKWGTISDNTIVLDTPAASFAFGIRTASTVAGDVTGLTISGNTIVNVGSGGSTTGITLDANTTNSVLGYNNVASCSTPLVISNATTVQPTLPGTGVISRTIASDAITITSTTTTVILSNEGGAAADDLLTISGGVTGQMIWLQGNSGAQVATVKGGGNIDIAAAGNFSLTTSGYTILLGQRGSTWYELARSVN